MRASAAVALAALLSATAYAAQWSLFERDYDEDQKPWAELEAQLPAYPKTQDLLPFDGRSASGHRFYVDPPSISVGDDGVVRYTLVMKTAGGATNVTFEGIRCETAEQKFYAVGRSDGKWIKARDPRWRRVEYRELNSYHAVLYQDFFCPDRHIKMTTVKQIIDALRRKHGPQRASTVAD